MDLFVTTRQQMLVIHQILLGLTVDGALSHIGEPFGGLTCNNFFLVVAPRIFALEELLAHMLSYFSPQDLFRSQKVNQALHQAVNSRGSLQKIFFIPNQDETQVAWNAFCGAAIPERFRTTRALGTPRIAGERRIITSYDGEDGKEAIRSSRAGKEHRGVRCRSVNHG